MEHDPKGIQMPSEAAEQERLARRLREAREYIGLSQEFVADQLGIPRAAVSALESAKRKVSGLELKKMAQLYRRTYEHLLGDEGPVEKEEAVTALYRATKKLSASDQEQVLNFARFLEQSGGPPRRQSDAQSGSGD